MGEHPVRFPQVTRATERLVGDAVAVDGDLRAVKNELTVDESGVEHRLAPTTTNRFQFLEGVRDFQKSARARKGDGLKVGANSVGQHRDVLENRDAKKVIDLVDTEELCFVDQQAGNVLARRRFRLGSICLEHRSNVVVRPDDKVHGTLNAQSGND